MKIIKYSSNPDENFIIPATDSQGNTARLWFRAVPSLLRTIEVIVQSKQFGYRTKGDFLRHAVHRHANWLSGKDDCPRTTVGQVNAIVAVLQDDEMNKDFSLIFHKLEERIKNHLADGGYTEAARLVLVVMRYIDEMPEGYWRSRYRDKMQSEYGSLLKRAQRANLGKVED